MPHPATVAVVDIGSNSIKLLVASADPAGRVPLIERAQRTEDTRIGTGITGNPPRLGAEAMERGVASVCVLLDHAAPYAPRGVRIVATSAARDAVNRDDFIARVRAATGHTLTVLGGNEEARLIGRGIACDPALAGASAFYLFDLGGGSLELLTFRDGRVAQLASLPLGCVRVTEQCLSDPARPLSAIEIEAVRARVREVIHASGFQFDLPAPVVAVATGGTATTFRAFQAAAAGRPLVETSATLPVAALNSLAGRLCSLSLDERRTIPGIPAPRADVFPAALLTFVEVAGFARATEFRHSFYNLRFGLAAELLEQLK